MEYNETKIPSFSDLFDTNISVRTDDEDGEAIASKNGSYTLIPGISCVLKNGKYFLDIQVKENVIIRLNENMAKCFLSDLKEKIKIIEKNKTISR